MGTIYMALSDCLTTKSTKATKKSLKRKNFVFLRALRLGLRPIVAYAPGGDYLGWLTATGNSKKLRGNYDHTLIEFLVFALREKLAWESMFSLDTLRMFKKHSTSLADAIEVLTGFSDYLYEEGTITEPLEVPRDRFLLPDIYEKYLLYLQHGKAVSKGLVTSSRRVLASLNEYLDKHNVDLSNLKIQHIDRFLAEFTKPFCNVTRGIYRNQIRGFLKYIHDEKVIKKDIAHLLVGPRMFGEPRPPRFLRPEEVKKLFGSITLDTPVRIPVESSSRGRPWSGPLSEW